MTQELNKIITNCTQENIEANIRIWKMGNALFNAQQMYAQLVVYAVLSISSYHASRSFKFINTLPPQEWTFVLKNIKSLKELSPNFTNVMCKSKIDKYIKRPRVIHNISLIKHVADYSINKRRKKSYVVRYVHYNQHRDPENYYRRQLLLFFICWKWEISQETPPNVTWCIHCTWRRHSKFLKKIYIYK